jgi:hypothetical protein
MSYSSALNIVCDVMNGKAYLQKGMRRSLLCAGECHACRAFLGTEPSDGGKPTRRASCDIFVAIRRETTLSCRRA